jgi:23S rRNA (guanosine2251-2'-O)-methyltransferase
MFKPQTKKEIKEVKRKDQEIFGTKQDLIFILQDTEDPFNVGSIFRTADGLGASIMLTGSTPKPGKEVSMLSRGLDRKVNWEYFKNFGDAYESLKLSGFGVYGLELTPESEVYFKTTLPKRLALVLGNESKGIYKKNLGLCQKLIHIPMLGKGPSLNVSVASGIIGYEFLRQQS